MRRRGFTIVELLVVLAALLLLIGMLAPSLSRVREMARRTLCATNLRTLATAVTNYYVDNRRALMCSASVQGAESMPTFILPEPDPDWDPGHSHWIWNIRSINPYVDSFSRTDPSTGGLFLCPGTRRGRWQGRFHEALNREFVEGPDTLIRTPYAYYAHVRSWEPFTVQNGAPDDLTNAHPVAEKILLSDGVHLGWNGRFTFNHGSHGPGDPSDNPSERSRPVGLNRAYGDGSVRWRDIDERQAQQMRDFFDYTEGFIGTGPGADAFFY
jgi:prepilin-type N-terminal cleavage/methylation domain-containing protein